MRAMMHLRVKAALTVIVLSAVSACDRPTLVIVPFPPEQPSSTGYTLLWQNTHAGAIARSVFDDSSVYFFDYYHVVTAVNKLTGAVEWRTPLTYATDPGERQGFGMAIAGGRLVVGDLDVFGINTKTGAIMWRFSPNVAPREQAGRGRLTSDGTTVFAGSVSGQLYALDAATGTERWRARVADSTLSVNNPILADGVLYVSLLGVYPSRAGGAAAVDARDGKLLWLTPTPPDSLKLTGASATVGVTPTLVVVGAENDKIYGLDRQTGEIRLTLSGATFRLPETGPIYSSVEFIITAFGSTVYVGSLGSMIAALDGSDLHVLWTARVAADVWDTRATSDRLYIAGVGGGLVVLRTLDGKLAWTAPGAAFPRGLGYEEFLAAPSIDTDRVYIGGDAGVYSFKKR